MRVRLSLRNEVAKSKKHFFLDFVLDFEIALFKASAMIMTKGFGNEQGIQIHQRQLDER